MSDVSNFLKNIRFFRRPEFVFSLKPQQVPFDKISPLEEEINAALKSLKMAEVYLARPSQDFRILCFNYERDVTAFILEIKTALAVLEFAKSKGLLNGYLFNKIERVMLYLRLLSDLKSVSYTYEELNSMYPFSRDQKLRGLKNLFSNYLILFSDFELFKDKHPVYRPYYLFYSCSALLLNMEMDIKKEIRKAA